MLRIQKLYELMPCTTEQIEYELAPTLSTVKTALYLAVDVNFSIFL